jgi:hypothetical protein
MIEEDKKENQDQYPDGTCPFRSNAKDKVPCSPDCQLYREGKKGFACVLHELATLSWNIRNSNRR